MKLKFISSRQYFRYKTKLCSAPKNHTTISEVKFTKAKSLDTIQMKNSARKRKLLEKSLMDLSPEIQSLVGFTFF